MEYRYSVEIDPSTYDDYGLCNGIPLRVHRDTYLETKGILRAQSDWSRLVRPLVGYKGGLGPQYSFVQVTVPECLPERLEIMSYANEFAFLYDDEMERLIDHDDLFQANNMVDNFGRASNQVSSLESRATKSVNKLQAKIFMEMKVLDAPRAETSMKAWSRFLQLASRTRACSVTTLQEYLPMRIIDAGELIWFGTLTFGMALTIPPKELNLCMELARPGYAILGLTNDLFSWKKEQQDAKKAGLDYVFNAVWVIMQEYNVAEATAMAICEDKIRDLVTEYNSIVEDASGDCQLSRDARAYLQAVMHSVVGNLVWSVYCPRYHELEDSDDTE